jgi:serine/threonine protein kinase
MSTSQANQDNTWEFLPRPILCRFDRFDVVAGSVIGGCRVCGVINHGGMGIVLDAHHIDLNRRAAVKLILPRWVTNSMVRARFAREAEMAANLDHPAFPTVYHADVVDPCPYLVMEYLCGTDLRRLVAKAGPLPLPRALSYIRQATVGLQYAHERGIVHRDIKPSNLLVDLKERVRILDLGVAKRSTPNGRGLGAESPDLTQPGVTLGTPQYLAPEQARDARLADTRSDIYSLGGTLFYLITGQDPDGAGLEMWPTLPAKLALLLRRMLAACPELRPQTTDVVIEELDTVSHGLAARA